MPADRSAASRDGSSVYVLDTYTAKPVYHDYGRLDIAREGDVTKCGLTLWDGQTRYAAALPRYRADLFAQACRRCFRDG